jgi:hypothetical protein
MVNVPADKTRRPEKVTVPEAVFNVVVPAKLPEGLKEREIEYGPLSVSTVTPELS